jgi:UDP-N-acetylglucosamine 3-dehydrogenase
MTHYHVGIIGCGRPWKSDGATGFGMANYHARGYAISPDTQIVALADLSLENAQAFQAAHGGERIYQDYREMLSQEQLDIVSICTWPHLHAEMVVAAAEAGVRAIHCEKPMAPTYGEARRMVEVCQAHGAQLTFNHQRRFSAQFRAARDLLRSGAIGELRRLEMTCPNMFDWGTHWFDMQFFYNDETPAEWVLGQVEPRGGSTVFGVPLERQGISHVGFRNGVEGLMLTRADGAFAATNRLVGSDGLIEVSLGSAHALRAWGQGQSGWQAVAVDLGSGSDLHEPIEQGVLDLIDALKTGREPELSGQRALRATELIFATYESSRRRGRVDLPLEIEDSPLLELLEERPA